MEIDRVVMRITLEPAFVLHHRLWRDSSMIVDLLTHAHGRLVLVARGARRPKTRWYGLLQPFRPLLISAVGRGEMGTLTCAEPRSVSAPPLGLPSGKLISGFYINELLNRLLARQDPHPRLFDAYESVIGALADPSLGASDEQRALRLFERTLLNEIGYGLVLDQDVATGRPIDAGSLYDYHPERGPVAVTGESAVRDEAGEPTPRTAVRLHGRSLIDISRGELHAYETLREAKHLMRMALGICLGGKPLRSRELFRSQWSMKTECGDAGEHAHALEEPKQEL